MKYTILIVALFVASFSAIGQTKQKIIYPVAVSFQSECCGVPSDSSVRSFIKSFKKQYKIKKIIAWHIGPMGREGEYYLAFKLNELTKKQASGFIIKLKKIRKFSSDKGLLSFKDQLEIDPATISPRTTTEKVIF